MLMVTCGDINKLATHWRPICFGSLKTLRNITVTAGDP
jgi:hypothetical protein